MGNYNICTFCISNIDCKSIVTGTQTTSRLATFWEVPRREAWSHVESGEPQEKPIQQYTASQNWFVHICALWELPKIANKYEQCCDVEGVFPLSWAAQRCNLVRRWPWCAHWRRSFWLWGLGFRLKELACQNQCRWFDDQQTPQEW